MKKYEIVKKMMLYVIPVVTTFFIASAYSAYVTQQMPTGIRILQSSVRAYNDQAATQLVSTIDFGIINQGTQTLVKPLYLKNQGTGTVTAYWTSTLSTKNRQIGEQWIHVVNGVGVSLNNTQMAAGDIWWTQYILSIPASAALGNYNWTITIGVTETYPPPCFCKA